MLWLLGRAALAQAPVQEVIVLAPARAAGQPVHAACYQKVELAVALAPAVQREVAGGTLNPYDPRQVDLTAKLYDADSGQPVQPPVLGFYTERFRTDADGQAVGQPLASAHPWHLRFVLARPGRYRLRLHCAVRQAPDPGPGQEAGFDVVATAARPGQHGPLGFPPGQPYLRFADGAPFFAIGENLADYSGTSSFTPDDIPRLGTNTYPPYAVRAYRQVLDSLHRQGGNFARLLLSPASFEVEWDSAGYYGAQQNRAQDLDQVLALAEQRRVYLQLGAFHYIDYRLQVEADPTTRLLLWDHNPYRRLPGVRLPIDVFRQVQGDSCGLNPDAEQLFANKLRYLVARWGYSPNLAALEIFAEFDNLDRDPALAPEGFYWSWRGCPRPNYYYVELMQRRLAARLRAWCPRLLLTSSPATYIAGASLFQDSAIAFTSFHFYSDLQNYGQLYNYVVRWAQHAYQKPVQGGECGFSGAWYQSDNHSEFRNLLWSSSFSGSFGTGLNWWSWGYLHHHWPGWPQGVDYMKSVARFFAQKDLTRYAYEPVRTPLVPDSAALRPCLPGGVGPPECLEAGRANRVMPDPNNDPALAAPASLLPSDRRLEAFALRSPGRVLGWVHHRDDYWYNRPHQTDPAQRARYLHPDAAGQVPATRQTVRYVTDLCGARLTVAGLPPGARYRLEWWQTLGPGGPRPRYAYPVAADAQGEVQLPVPDLVAADARGNGPDYAFKLLARP